MAESDSIQGPILDFINRRALTAVGDNTFIGWHHDLPIAVTPSIYVNLSAENENEEAAHVSILTQLRFVGVPEDFDLQPDDIRDAEVRHLVESGRVHVTSDNTIAQLTAFEVDAPFLEAQLPRCLDVIHQCIQQAGGHGNSRTCHYCGTRQIESLTWIDDRVAQVCGHCLEEKLAEAEREKRATGAGALNLIIATLVGAFVATPIWAGLWWLDFRLLGLMRPPDATEVTVPNLLWLAVLLTIAFAAGVPIGLIVASVQRGGIRLPKYFALLAGLIAAVVGDVVLMIIQVRQEDIQISPLMAFRLLPDYWIAFHSYTVKRIMTMIIMLVIAAMIADHKVKRRIK